MKKLTSTLLCVFLTCAAQAQWIDQLQVFPPSPSANDPITIVVSESFPSGSCDQKDVQVFQQGKVFYGSALHCLGMLTFICNDKDSFLLGLLPAGTYKFVMQLNAGSGNFPCSPGIVPGPTDSISFTVTSVTGIDALADRDYQLYPNPASNVIYLKSKEQLKHTGSELVIRDANGRICLHTVVKNETEQIVVSQLSPGFYCWELKDDVQQTISFGKLMKLAE